MNQLNLKKYQDILEGMESNKKVILETMSQSLFKEEEYMKKLILDNPLEIILGLNLILSSSDTEVYSAYNGGQHFSKEVNLNSYLLPIRVQNKINDELIKKVNNNELDLPNGNFSLHAIKVNNETIQDYTALIVLDYNLGYDMFSYSEDYKVTELFKRNAGYFMYQVVKLREELTDIIMNDFDKIISIYTGDAEYSSLYKD